MFQVVWNNTKEVRCGFAKRQFSGSFVTCQYYPKGNYNTVQARTKNVRPLKDNPEPTDPKPTNPKPTNPKPTNRKPTDPKPKPTTNSTTTNKNNISKWTEVDLDFRHTLFRMKTKEKLCSPKTNLSHSPAWVNRT